MSKPFGIPYSAYMEHAGKCVALQNDIEGQMIHLNASTGSVKDAYKKIILDKIWKLNRLQGEFYHKALAQTTESETEYLQVNRSIDATAMVGTCVMPQLDPQSEEE
jgi:hypothetical protein